MDHVEDTIQNESPNIIIVQLFHTKLCIQPRMHGPLPPLSLAICRFNRITIGKLRTDQSIKYSTPVCNTSPTSFSSRLDQSLSLHTGNDYIEPTATVITVNILRRGIYNCESGRVLNEPHYYQPEDTLILSSYDTEVNLIKEFLQYETRKRHIEIEYTAASLNRTKLENITNVSCQTVGSIKSDERRCVLLSTVRQLRDGCKGLGIAGYT